LANWFYWQGTLLFLQIKLQPGASKDSIVGPHGDHIKIRITAPPVDGKANKHLIKFLAACFGVPQKNVKIEKGDLNRLKLVRIDTPKDLPILEIESGKQHEDHIGE
jgi:uncharacterized protein (TIGR00251 family)